MLVELQLDSAHVLPQDLETAYVGETSDGYDAAIIPNVWQTAETTDGGVGIELINGDRYTISNAAIVKSGDARGALDIPGSELAEIGEIPEESNQWQALVALADCLADTGDTYATPAAVADYTSLDRAATRQALSTLFALKDALTRRPAGRGRGGIQFQFGLTPQAEQLVAMRSGTSDPST